MGREVVRDEGIVAVLVQELPRGPHGEDEFRVLLGHDQVVAQDEDAVLVLGGELALVVPVGLLAGKEVLVHVHGGQVFFSEEVEFLVEVAAYSFV